ncbi:RodZ family helix-turn-helix domain-containing protein [Thermotoga sp. KOL6]|uniref:helix-turn-helix domain-containing protein n=1 Tax=Thermotoga sp. KOL6 TaxID=126741 RepID=UPI000C77A790|nr:helix-turn-helix domain-containing protein [Thermotoga sp. KOL6]PLV60412.1 DNA-binding protein [Thermotoga sp. KOL6]
MSEKWKELGETFKKRREERRITLLDASLFTNINPSKLKRIEEGDLQNLDAEIYVKSYIRRYAEFLELPSEEMLQMYEEGKKETTLEEGLKKEKKKGKEKERGPQNVVLISFLVVGIVLLIFSISENIKLRRTPPAYLVSSKEIILNGTPVKGEVPLFEGKYTVETEGDIVLRTSSEEWTVKLKKFEVMVSWEK